jgi:hypothetical protein
MKSFYDHTVLLCELAISLLIRGIQMGKKCPNLVFLIGLVKHAINAESMYFLYLLLHSTSRILASFQPAL